MQRETLEDNYQQELREIYHQKLDVFLENHGWVENTCPKCGRSYLSKSNRLGCGDVACNGTFEFLTDQRKEKICSPYEVNLAFRLHFEKEGFLPHPSKTILNENGTTLFTSAGVQVLDDCVLRNSEAPAKTLIVSQPSLRTQYLNSIGEGNSLSFVNISTETVNTSPEQHFANLDKWLEFISKLGLYVGDITLHKRSLTQKWGSTTLQSEIMAVYYKGLEIGDGNYDYNISPKPAHVGTISDFGFGLERLTWLLHKGSYFDSVGPLTESIEDNNLTQELSKTLTLLASSGLEPSNKDKGYRYRLFAKKLVDSAFPAHLALNNLAMYYHEYWSNFIQLPLGKEEVASGVQAEYDRNYNLRLKLNPNGNVDVNCNTEEYLLRLLKAGVSRNIIVQLIKKR